jgi:hypothetical protein
MDPMVIMVLVVVGGTLGLALLAGGLDRRAGSRLAGQSERRDPVATGNVKGQAVDEGLDRENKRRRGRGLRRLRRSEYESMVVADGRTRRRLRLFKGRR